MGFSTNPIISGIEEVYPVVGTSTNYNKVGGWQGPALSLYFLGNSLPNGVSFSRASNATQFDDQGRLVWAPSQLLSATNNLANGTRWTALGSLPVVITSGQTDPVGGAGAFLIDVSAFADCRVAQDLGAGKTPAGGSITMSVWIRTVPGDPDGTWGMQFRKKDATTPITTVAINSTWQRISWTLDLGAGASSALWWMAQRSAGGTSHRALLWQPMISSGDVVWPYIENMDVSGTVAIYGPRFDYNPSTLAALGLLVEPARTNLVPIIGIFGQSGYVYGGMGNPTQGVTRLGWSFHRITGDGASGSHFCSGGSTATLLASSTAYTVSVYAIAGTQSLVQLTVSANHGASDCYANFDLGAGTVVGQGAGAVAPSIIAVGGGVYRLSMSFVTLGSVVSNGASPLVSLITGAADTRLPVNTLSTFLDLFGYQLELGNFATSLIPTFGVSATRAGDVADLVAAPPYSSTGMTYAAQFIRQANPTNSGAEATSSLFYFGDGNTHVSGVFGFGATSQSRCDLGNSGVPESQVSVTTQPVVPLQVYKWATRFAPNDSVMAANGVLGTADTTVNMPVSLPSTRLSVGRANSASTQQMCGWLRGLQIYTQALPNATLQALST